METANYISFFRNLAQLHPAILHDPLTEGLNGKPNQCKFGKFWNPDIFSKTPISGVIPDTITLVAHLPEANLDNKGGEYDINASNSGGFIVSKRAIKGNVADEESCFTATSEVVKDILREFQAQNTELESCDRFARFEFSSMDIQSVGPIWDNRYGYFVSFNYITTINLDRDNPFRP